MACMKLISKTRSQELFYHFAIDQDIDIHNFSCSDLINFLLSAHHSGYSLNIIKLYKTATFKFHCSPGQFLKGVDILALLKKFANDAPPIPLGRSAIDLSPTFHHLIAFHPQAAHNLHAVNEVAAFLLVQLSTDTHPAPSVRLLGIDLAIARGITVADVGILGNWSSDAAMDTNY
ncbi:hypothetical protein BJV82DRAFT_699106 [Fennellomyces sp. T-0311]|nr:hypothetical protein BJV82DRAFT_699106 [Fennellomyces sp. T-0311]